MVDAPDLKSVDRKIVGVRVPPTAHFLFEMEFPLTSLKLWLDPIQRSGPENMAVDEWLLETIAEPILRIYEWKGAWGSLGRFCELNQATESLINVCLVRRSTGGGIVDHQNDWTYSLVIPEKEKLAQTRASESYRTIHEALSFVLSDCFRLVSQVPGVSELGGVCFEKPVAFDVIDDVGNKIAGAGQRRTKEGLLHQGSVFGKCNPIDSIDRSKRFCAVLSPHWTAVELVPPTDVIRRKVAERYANEEWTKRR